MGKEEKNDRMGIVMKEKIIVIVGPTAVGKTFLSIELAKRFNGEIISGDSLQVYRKLDIGTAKATKEEQEGISHFLLDVREPDETYTAFDFKREAEQKIQEIVARGHVPIIVGGTGLYIQALLFDFQLGKKESTIDQNMRRKYWEDRAAREGKEAMWLLLQDQDPKAARVIHQNNVKRVLRALEVFENTGKSILDQQQIDLKAVDHMQYDAYLLGLTTERSILYDRINKRVDLMLDKGLLEEAKFLYELGPVQASQGIGYKELFPFFEGSEEWSPSVEKIKQHSRQYAKRQMTWFRNRMNINWWDLITEPEDIEKIEKEITGWLNQ